MYLLLSILLVILPVHSCGGFQPVEQYSFQTESCSWTVDNIRHPEYEPYLDKFVLLWFGEGWSAAVIYQIDYAVSWYSTLYEVEKEQVQIIFINKAGYAAYLEGMQEHEDEGVIVVQESLEEDGEWSWDYYRGAKNTARLIDDRGFAVDFFSDYGSKHSSMASSNAPIKQGFEELLDEGSPCWYMPQPVHDPLTGSPTTSAPTDCPSKGPASLAPTTSEPTKEPSLNPLPYLENEVRALQDQAAQLEELVEKCEEFMNDSEKLQAIENTLDSCFVTGPEVEEVTTGTEVKNPYEYKQLDWYQNLLNTDDVFYLSNADFTDGTYRIQTSGRYILTEDIVFDPRPDDESFPGFYDPDYPMNYYFLGFFAAIAIETSDVYIDLNGYEIRQSLRHNTLQRFYNHIELNDRIFVTHEGMTSLNYQSNDDIQYSNDAEVTHGEIVSAKNVIIANGVLGLSSHNGIHGNGNQHVVVENLHVRDFEVAGVQLNGADNVAINTVEIGPSNDNVLFKASWSNAVVMKRYLELFIPESLEHLGVSHLLDEEVSFADRPDEVFTIQEVFESLIAFTDSYTEFVVDGVEVDDYTHKFFNNTLRLPDGSAMYGLFLHRLGAGPETFGAQDENYLGPEHENIAITNVNIHDLKIAPVMVPSIVFADGTILQGPARDVVDILTILRQPATMGIPQQEYEGNPLVDAYIAMAKLSGLYYTTHVFNSKCGNFASNLTASYAIRADDCDGTVMTSYTGRQSTMLQKRIFGGIQLSQRFLDWATIPGTVLDSLFTTAADIVERRQTKHRLVCNHDALFHPNKGLVGIRAEFIQEVIMQNISMTELSNTGDDNHWLCTRKYRLENLELLKAEKNKPGRHLGADIRGFAISKTENIQIQDIYMNNLISEEGAVIGFDIMTDTSDRSDYETNEVSFAYDSIDIQYLKGGAGHLVKHFESQLVSQQFDLNVKSNNGLDFHNEFDNAKISWVYEANALTDCGAGDATVCETMTGLSAERMTQLNKDFEKYIKVYFGIDIGYNHLLPWFITPETDDWYILHSTNYGPIHMVCRKDKCSLPHGSGMVYEKYQTLIPKKPFVVHGTFGGIEGKMVYPQEFLVAGFYTMDGIIDRQIEMQYFAECPLSFTDAYYESENFDTVHRLSYMINCDLISEELGRGVSIGLFGGYCAREEPLGFFSSSLTMMTFDDHTLTYFEDDSDSAPTTTGQFAVIWESVEEGRIPISMGRAGVDIHPMTNAYYQYNEAAIKYFKYWLDYSDEQIAAFRRDALEWFISYMYVNDYDPDLFDNDPLDNTLDLPRGNKVLPFTTNEYAAHRLVGRKSSSGAVLDNSRIHTVGFVLRVGRAGIRTFQGTIPFGSVIHFGMYIVEFEDSIVPIKFYDLYPQSPNTNNHLALIQKVIHPEYNVGLLQGLIKVTPDENNNMFVSSSRFTWKWDNPTIN